MSMFGGFSTFSKALESIGQMVAPVDENDQLETSGLENDEADGNGHSFDSDIMRFIQKRRADDGQAVEVSAASVDEPPSPSSLVEVSLDDDTPQPAPAAASPRLHPSSLPVVNSLLSALSSPPSLIAASLAPKQVPAVASTSSAPQFVSSRELEAKVQHKYRQQLEDALAVLQSEVAMWKERATGVGSVVASSPDPPVGPPKPCTQCQAAADELAASRQALAVLEDKLAQATAEHRRQAEAAAATTEKSAAQLQQLQAESRRLGDELSASSLRIQQRDSDVNQLSALLRAKEEELSKAQLQAQSAEEENSELRSQLRLQRELVIDAERSNDQLANQIAELEVLAQNHMAQSSARETAEAASVQSETAACVAEADSSARDDGEVNRLRHSLDEAQSSLSRALADHAAALAGKDREIARFETALQQSEDLLKAAEEVAWKSKAEAAEYLSALEFEQSKLAQLQSTVVSGSSAVQELEDQLKKILDTRLFPAVTALVSIENSQAGLEPRGDRDTKEALLYTAETVDAIAQQVSQRQQVLSDDLQAQLSASQNQALVFEREKDVLASTCEALRQQVADASEQLLAQRAAVQRLENENRQLHQVIQQLRQTRKQQSGEAENALTELVQLRVFSQQCKQENQEMQLKLANYNEMAVAHGQLSTRTSELEAEVSRLSSLYQETKRYLSNKEKECFDLKAKLEVLQAEQRMLQRENDTHNLEIGNLRDALASLESDHSHALHQSKQLLQELAQVKKDLELQLADQSKAQVQDAMREMELKLKAAEQRAGDQELMTRQAQWEFFKEKERLQKKLEEVISQLQNSSQDVIDRALVANLVVSFLQRRKSREVLELIAKVLAFNEEQLIAVGLRVPPINILSSLLQTVIGPPEPEPVEGGNLAELWVNFLLKQSDGKSPKTGGGGQSTTPRAETARPSSVS